MVKFGQNEPRNLSYFHHFAEFLNNLKGIMVLLQPRLIFRSDDFFFSVIFPLGIDKISSFEFVRDRIVSVEQAVPG